MTDLLSRSKLSKALETTLLFWPLIPFRVSTSENTDPVSPVPLRLVPISSSSVCAASSFARVTTTAKFVTCFNADVPNWSGQDGIEGVATIARLDDDGLFLFGRIYLEVLSLWKQPVHLEGGITMDCVGDRDKTWQWAIIAQATTTLLEVDLIFCSASNFYEAIGGQKVDNCDFIGHQFSVFFLLPTKIKSHWQNIWKEWHHQYVTKTDDSWVMSLYEEIKNKKMNVCTMRSWPFRSSSHAAGQKTLSKNTIKNSHVLHDEFSFNVTISHTVFRNGNAFFLVQSWMQHIFSKITPTNHGWQGRTPSQEESWEVTKVQRQVEAQSWRPRHPWRVGT